MSRCQIVVGLMAGWDQEPSWPQSSRLGAPGHEQAPTALGEIKAEASHHQGLQLWDKTGQRVGVAYSLEASAALRPIKGRGPHRRPTTGWASLTRPEHDVALLAAQGMTNAEIGQRLFISPRTAKAHLAHIPAKLGIASRRELPGRKAIQERQPPPR